MDDSWHMFCHRSKVGPRGGGSRVGLVSWLHTNMFAWGINQTSTWHTLCILILATLLSGCAGPGWIFEPLIYRNQGGMSPATRAHMFLSRSEAAIADEVEGRTPTAGIPTWEEWWRTRYEDARESKPPEIADYCIR